MLNFFMRFSNEFDNKQMKEFVNNSLLKMSRGGINDRIDGGFHRYTIDNAWHTFLTLKKCYMTMLNFWVFFLMLIKFSKTKDLKTKFITYMIFLNQK